MSRREVVFALLLMLGTSGCFLDRSGLGQTDPDAAVADAAPRDGEASDAGGGDAGPEDGGPVDGGPVDGGPVDGGPVDGGPVDGGPVDGGPVDGGPADACVPSPDLCNGLDDDCNPDTPDGAGESTLGMPCDSGDDDLCEDDRVACVDGALICVDDGSDAEEVELCNGLDDDCNPDTPDGADESTLNEACDSVTDDDLCLDDMILCVAAVLSCVDDLSDVEEAELCNGVDDDCDGSIDDDGVDDPGVGASCDGPDSDMCLDGVGSCDAGALVCIEFSAGFEETGCDGIDEDCDGQIDEGFDCGCPRVMFNGHAYLFCESGDGRRSWRGARDFCDDLGYRLVAIESEDEQRFVTEQTRARERDREWWIGASDIRSEGNFVWEDDPPRPVVGGYWNRDEPNNFLNAEDCAVMQPWSSGGWNDVGCSSVPNRRFVCEAGP